MKMSIKDVIAVCAGIVMTVAANAVSYPSTTNGTEPNEWTRNYTGVMEAANTTGYPVLLLFVGSTCAHCEVMMNNTIMTTTFEEMDKDLVFYKVLVVNGVSASTDGIIMSKYSGYLNGGAFPITAVLRKDGSVYGSYGNATTDTRGVASELRDLIESLAVEQIGYVQHRDGSTTPGAEVAPTAVSASAWAVALRGKVNGVVFDASQNIIGSLTMKIANKGNVTAKLTLSSGRENLKGGLALNEEGNPYFSAGGLSLAYDPSFATWIGAYNGGGVVLASANAVSSYAGLYTAGAESADGAKPGYFTATAKAEKCKLAGLVDGRNKVSANGVGASIPSRVVAANLPAWDVGSDLAFYPAISRNVSGGIAISSSGVANFVLTAAGVRWTAQGRKWSTSANLQSLEGKTMSFAASAGTIDIPLVWNGRTIAAGDNDYKAKFKPNVRKGIFKGAAKIGGERYTFEGALLQKSSGVAGVGDSYGAGVSKVTVGDDECDSCTVAEQSAN